MRGTGFLPISGGLLLGDDAASALTSTNAFPISQDQRHTIRGRVAYQLSDRAWVAMAASYGSGLPVEFTGDPAPGDRACTAHAYQSGGFRGGRVRPSASLDAASSAIVFKTQREQVRVQANVIDLTDRLNVINFAGLFSGTALAAPRSFGFRVNVDSDQRFASRRRLRAAHTTASPKITGGRADASPVRGQPLPMWPHVAMVEHGDRYSRTEGPLEPIYSASRRRAADRRDRSWPRRR